MHTFAVVLQIFTCVFKMCDGMINEINNFNNYLPSHLIKYNGGVGIAQQNTDNHGQYYNDRTGIAPQNFDNRGNFAKITAHSMFINDFHSHQLNGPADLTNIGKPMVGQPSLAHSPNDAIQNYLLNQHDMTGQDILKHQQQGMAPSTSNNMDQQQQQDNNSMINQHGTANIGKSMVEKPSFTTSTSELNGENNMEMTTAPEWRTVRAPVQSKAKKANTLAQPSGAMPMRPSLAQPSGAMPMRTSLAQPSGAMPMRLSIPSDALHYKILEPSEVYEEAKRKGQITAPVLSKTKKANALAQPSGAMPMRPSLAQPSGAMPMRPSLAQPPGAMPMRPSLAQPSGVMPMRPSLAQPSGAMPMRPSLAQPSGAMPMRPSISSDALHYKILESSEVYEEAKRKGQI